MTTFDPAAGTTIVNNNVAISVPPGAAGDANGGALTITLTGARQPAPAAPSQTLAVQESTDLALPVPAGAASYRPDGTVFRVAIANQQGASVRAFAAPVTLFLKYSAADLAGVRGDPALLTAAYLVDASTPAPANPNSMPAGSWIFFPSSAVTLDPIQGLVTVQAQALGQAVAIFSKPAPEVQTVHVSTPLLSGVDAEAQVFGSRPAGTRLIVVEPETQGRMLVFDRSTQSYAYVGAGDIAPTSIQARSGPAG